MKKTLALVLALVLALASMSFAVAEDAPKGTIKYLMSYCSTDPNLEPPAAKIDELTGFKTTYYMLPSSGADEKLNLELASGAEYDIIRCSIAQFNGLVTKGAFVALDDYLPTTTYLKDIMTEEEWASAAYDGKIYGIPQFDALYVSGSVAINVDLWGQAGYTVTDDRELTLDEFEAIMLKIKDLGVIPYTGSGAFVNEIAAAFGIVSHDWQPDLDGSITHRFLHSNMPAYIEYMHKLYTLGILDSEWAVNKGENVTQKFTSGLAATFSSGWSSTTANEAALTAATGAKTDYLWPLSDNEGFSRFSSNGGVRAFGVIPTTCKQVETVIEYLDLRANPDIFLESFLGVEGEQWEFRDTNNDGELEYWPLLGEEHNPGFTAWFNGHYFNIVNSSSSFTTMWLCRARKSEVQYNATYLQNLYPRDRWVDSALAFAPPMDAVSAYAQALNVLTNDYIIECIVGTRSVDEYQDVVAEFLAEGGEEMIEEVRAYVESIGGYVKNVEGANIYDSNLMTQQ